MFLFEITWIHYYSAKWHFILLPFYRISILALHEALVRQPRDPLVVATFALALYLGGDMSLALDIGKSINRQHGVETVDGSHKARISGITHVPLDFPVICKEIAEGHPLLAIIRTGKGFDDLQYNQIYKPPKVSRIVDGKSAGLHCITLVGGAMRKGRKMHYKFVNTHGEEFCKLRSLNRDDGIKGGLGNVIAEGILRRPVKFLREGRGSV
uniref:Uncharacterized protein n=1 Tax=Oryza glumipatula TaxID=40148 RepID=A0A0E0AY48_9ORYZ